MKFISELHMATWKRPCSPTDEANRSCSEDEYEVLSSSSASQLQKQGVLLGHQDLVSTAGCKGLTQFCIF
jgi:hypothetical protein